MSKEIKNNIKCIRKKYKMDLEDLLKEAELLENLIRLKQKILMTDTLEGIRLFFQDKEGQLFASIIIKLITITEQSLKEVHLNVLFKKYDGPNHKIISNIIQRINQKLKIKCSPELEKYINLRNSLIHEKLDISTINKDKGNYEFTIAVIDDVLGELNDYLKEVKKKIPK